jgi:hypothetical protein
LQDIAPAPLARTISYNIKGPISALGYQSPTLAQLISRYATLDPTLTSSASDKRKAPSLVAPSAAKKKRTTKKLLIQVRALPFLNIKLLFILIIFILCDFRPELNNHWSLQILPMLHLLVKFSPSYFLISSSSLALILYLLVAEETLVSQTVGSSSPQHDSNPTSPRIQSSSPQAEASALPMAHQLLLSQKLQPYQWLIQLLLSQKLQLYQGLLKLLLNQTSKNPSSSLKNFLPQLGKPEMM